MGGFSCWRLESFGEEGATTKLTPATAEAATLVAVFAASVLIGEGRTLSMIGYVLLYTALWPALVALGSRSRRYRVAGAILGPLIGWAVLGQYQPGVAVWCALLPWSAVVSYDVWPRLTRRR